MITQSTYKAGRYNGRPVADDLVPCCWNFGLGLVRLQFPVVANAMKDIWEGLNLLEGLQVIS